MRFIVRSARALGLAALLALPAPVIAQPAQATDGSSRIGTLVVAHGANAEWNSHVRAVVTGALLPGPVRLSFLMGPEAATTRFQDAIQELEADGATAIVVVPLFVSSHSEHYQQVRFLAGLTDSIDHALHAHMDHGGVTRATVTVPIVVTPALDDDPTLAQILAERARNLSRDPAREALFLVGHGPGSAEDYAAWMANLRPIADSVRARVPFADVRVDLVRDDAPPPVRREAVLRVRELIALQHAVTRDTVIVVPVLISRGRISRETFLKDLAGLPVRYSGDPLLPHRALSHWLERRVAAAAPVTTSR